VFATIAERVGIQRRDVAGVFHVMAAIIKADLSKGVPGYSSSRGLMRITVQRKPATKARMGINPFTKEEVMFKAKPARNVVRCVRFAPSKRWSRSSGRRRGAAAAPPRPGRHTILGVFYSGRAFSTSFVAPSSTNGRVPGSIW